MTPRGGMGLLLLACLTQARHCRVSGNEKGRTLSQFDADALNGKDAAEFVPASALLTLGANTVDGKHAGEGTVVSGRLCQVSVSDIGDVLSVPGFGVIWVAGAQPCFVKDPGGRESVCLERGALRVDFTRWLLPSTRL